MGEVYRARDTRLGRDVAIKTSAERFSERFEREAHAIASLSHPNICTLFDVGPDYLVMELVEGPTLGERIAAGPIAIEEALVLAHQIADALEAAHEKGIVHRDLKPANIKLTADGKIKVLDFGLAKAFDAGSSSGSPVNSPTLTLDSTRAGMIMGTAGYMSPEQARGKPVDKRADIWAFGVVLLEMLTGRSTFEGETVSDTLAAVLRADIDWKQLPAGVPAKVRRLIARCLERDARKRLRDIGDAWIELDTPDEPAAAAAPIAPQRARAWWLGWALAAAIGAAGIGWGVLHRTPEEPRAVVRWTYSPKELLFFPSLSRDGSRLVVSEGTESAPRLALRMMDQLEARPLSGAENMFFGEFSPDGQWIAAFGAGSDGKVKKIPVTGGTPITLADASAPGGLTWGDDGTIVFSNLKNLMRVSSAGGKAETLTTPDAKKGELAHRTPHFLPGARALVFTIASAGGTQVAVLDLKKGGYRVVANNGLDGRYVPTGHLVYARGGALFAEPFDAGRLEVTGPEAPVVEGVSVNGPAASMAEFAFADSGLLMYVEGAVGTSGGTTMGWADRQGQVQPLSDTQLWGTGRLSPDGRKIANEIYSGGNTTNGAGPGDIWVFENERKTRTRLTFGGENSYPIWTPDGRRITYGAKANGKTGIDWVMADGSGKPEQLLATDSAAAPSSWSPDGKFLLYWQGDTQPRIWVVPVSGGAAGKPFPLHDAAASEFDGEVSPDGRWVAYVSTETGQQEVYVQAFPGPGGKERVSTQGGQSVRWARSGRELFYRGALGEVGLMAVDVQTAPQFHVGLPKLVVKGTFGTTWDVTPDGTHFLIELIGGSAQGDRRMIGISDWFDDLRRRVPVKR
jgi:serine/threonine-protein kinase